MKRLDQLTQLTAAQVAQDDIIGIRDQSAGQTKYITVKDLTGSPDFGWSATGESWAYSSWNATTKIGVITVPTDATTKYVVGMFVRFAQTTGGTKWGKILSLTATTLTVWMPGQTLNNEAITVPVYSGGQAPLGLPVVVGQGNPYEFSVWRNAALNTSALYPVYDTEEYDNTDNYSTVNGRFTAPVSGIYMFNYGAIIASPGMGPSYSGIDKNGGEFKRCTEVPSMASGNNTISGSSFAKLNAGEYVNVRLSMGTVSNLVVGNQAYNWFNGTLVSRI